MSTRVGGALLLLVAEAAWATLLFDALADGSAGPGRPAISLPYLAIAVPAVAAALVAYLAAARRVSPLWWAATAVAAVALAALTAELVSSLTPGVALWSAPVAPLAARAVTWASVVAVLAWARGAWLGVRAPSARHATASCLLGAVVIMVVVVGRSNAHASAYTRATGDAGWLLVVFFMAGVTAVAWAHHQSVQPAVTRGGGGPGVVWLAIMGVPLLALVAFAFLVGGAGGVAGPAAVRAARDLGWAIAHLVELAHLHLRLLLAGHSSAHAPPGYVRGQIHPPRPAHASSNAVLDALSYVVSAVLVGLAALMVVSGAWLGGRWVIRRLRRDARPTATTDEQRDSLFTWRHLWEQLCAGFARRRRRRSVLGAPIGASTATRVSAPRAELDPVREAYLEFLHAAQAAELGRSPTETPRELATRLTLDHRALRTLTGAYERVRYGLQDPEEGRASATLASNTLTSALDAQRPTSRDEAAGSP